jgi:hypothetical protein
MSTLPPTQTETSGSGGTADAAKGAAADVAHDASSAASDVKDTARTEAASVARDAADRAGAVLRTGQDELRTQAESKAKDLSSSLDEAARQLGSMAEGADDPDSTVAQLSRSAADQLRSQSQRLEERGLEGLFDDAKRLARNRPGVFMLGTVAAGFAFGRLAKHANPKQVMDAAKQELTSGGDSASDQGTAGTSVGRQQPMTPATGTTTSPSPSPTVGTQRADPTIGVPSSGAGGGIGGQS